MLHTDNKKTIRVKNLKGRYSYKDILKKDACRSKQRKQCIKSNKCLILFDNQTQEELVGIPDIPNMTREEIRAHRKRENKHRRRLFRECKKIN